MLVICHTCLHLEHIYPETCWTRSLPPHTMEATFDKSGEVKSEAFYSDKSFLLYRQWKAQCVT